MQKLYYQFPGTWFGDCMPFGHGDKFYLYHQRDTRKPGPFGEPFGWDLATTSDFVHYEDKGVAIPRGTDEEQDQFIFAGSVFEAEGQYHIFYTGYNRDYPALGKPSQVLMHQNSIVIHHKCFQTSGNISHSNLQYFHDTLSHPSLLSTLNPIAILSKNHSRTA